jgi:hypothetical protein
LVTLLNTEQSSDFELKPIYLPSSKLVGIGGAHGGTQPIGHVPVWKNYDQSTKYLTPEERKTYRGKIDGAASVTEADKARYQRYLENFGRDPSKASKPPLNQEQWETQAKQMRRNHMQGYGVEDIPLERLGLDNNNYNVDRAGNPREVIKETHTDPKTGKLVGTRPDGIGEHVIVDVKSMEGKDKVYNLTEQLRAEQALAESQGKTHGTILYTEDPSYHPSSELAKTSVVARYDPIAKGFSIWNPKLNNKKGGWEKATNEELLDTYKAKATQEEKGK